MVRLGQKRWRNRVFAFLRPKLFIVTLCVLGVAYMENVLWKLKIRSLRCSGKSTTEGISDRVNWMQDLGRQNVERKIFLRNINLPGSEVFEQTAAKSWFLLLPGLPWLQRSWFLIGRALAAYGGENLIPCLSVFCTVVHNDKSIVTRSFVHDRGPWGRALHCITKGRHIIEFGRASGHTVDQRLNIFMIYNAYHLFWWYTMNTMHRFRWYTI